MKGSKIALGIIAAFIVRALLSTVWFGVIRKGATDAMVAAHPGMFKSFTNPTPFIIADLIGTTIFVLLLSRVSAGLGGGIGAGVKLGIYVALLAPVLGSVYEYFSFSFADAQSFAIDGAFQIVAGAIVGAVAAAVLSRGEGQARTASA